MLVLAEPVVDIEPMALSDFPPEVGELVTLVGFGGQGTAESGSDGSFGEKLFGVTTVDAVSLSEISWRFDGAEESNPAPGDSGGPVLVDTGEAYLVVGIVSSGTRADAGLGDTTFSMRVDAYEPWITGTVEATQAELDEPTTPAGSEETPGDPTEETPEDTTDEIVVEQPLPDPDQPVEPAAEVPGPASGSECPAVPAAPAEVDGGQDSAAESEPGQEASEPEEAGEPPAAGSTEEVASEEQAETGPDPGSSGGSCKGNRRRFGSRRPTGGYHDASRHYALATRKSHGNRVNVRRR